MLIQSSCFVKHKLLEKAIFLKVMNQGFLDIGSLSLKAKVRKDLWTAFGSCPSSLL